MKLTCRDLGASNKFDSSTNADEPSSERQRSHSVISLSLLNEKGEKDLLEIDEADSEGADTAESRSSVPEFRVRSHSITERINRRRSTLFAFEINRLSAAGREEELLQLLKEHSQLVHTIRLWSKIAQQGSADSFDVQMPTYHKQTQSNRIEDFQST
nr:unnamed protein product [Spirometra erinaceieuropaei]